MAFSPDTGITQSASIHMAAEESLPLVIAWAFPQPQLTRLEGDTITLGRSREANLHLPGKQTSRIHAKLIRTRHAWLLQDQNSKNGVQLNGQTVTEGPLSEQDVIRVGEWLGVVTRSTERQLQANTIVIEESPGVLASARLLQALDLLERGAKSDLSIMLIGETGSGKEVFARMAHRVSARAGDFVATNCATIPESMAEAELFGYGRGAFTGAAKASLGHFRSAHEGTLFLDEIPDLAPAVQVKLLRAIEEKAVVPLGQSMPEPAHARLVCAAQKPLHEHVERGTFRADLYSRLNGVEVNIPPLRKRREEILFHFQNALGSGGARLLSPEVAEQLCLYDWPLNVREVVQAAHRTQALHSDVEYLQLSHLPERIATFSQASSSASSAPQSAPVSESIGTEDAHPRDRLAQRLAQALRQAGGNVSVAAKNLGVSRPMAYRLMKRLPDLDPEEIRVGSLEN